jgi:hypothetical protein
VLDTDRKGLPGNIPNMEEMVDQYLYTGGNYFEGDGGW